MKNRLSNCLMIFLVFVVVFFLTGYMHFRDVAPSFELSNTKTHHLLPTNECVTIQSNELIFKGCEGLTNTELAINQLPTEGRKKDCIKSGFTINRPNNSSNQSYFTGISIKSTDKTGFNEIRVGIDAVGQMKAQFYLDKELVEEQKHAVDLPKEMEVIFEITSAKHYSYFGRGFILFSVRNSQFSSIKDGYLKINYKEIGKFTGEKTVGLFLETTEENASLQTTITDFIIRKDWASQD